ncbi:MAG: hypothetical protein E6J85_14590 [Deltaproteobacteria bacterium]|nr:MAG: hypothetical protein E6J85_14590 [Deltaproteobacteria bacterium]
MQKYLLVLLLAVAGCRRAEVSRYQVKKTAEMQAPLFAQERPRAEPIPDSPAASLPNALAWTLPRGWTERRAAGVRYATLKPAVGGKIDVSVVVLPGPAGGELANVNRWRGQIGLASIDERDLARARRSIKTRAGAVSVFDFVSDGNKKSRLLAAIVVSDESTWFIKMLGDESPVASSRPDFIHLLQSLHFDAAS